MALHIESVRIGPSKQKNRLYLRRGNLHFFFRLVGFCSAVVTLVNATFSWDIADTLDHQGPTRLELDSARSTRHQDYNETINMKGNEATARKRGPAQKKGNEPWVPGLVAARDHFNHNPHIEDSHREAEYHLVFSTGCSTFQDWQSYVFFYHVMHSGQRGHVTRIASGCRHEEARQLRQIFANEIAVMAPGRFHLHLTPDFSHLKPGIDFKYFNKPCGMKHWMEHRLGYPEKHVEHDNTVIILLDPDQILIQPFTDTFSDSLETWRLKSGYKLHVEHGSPFAQEYGYGLHWRMAVNITEVFQGASPAATMGRGEALDYYMAMGPPYIATGKDMYTIVRTWARIVPRIHDQHPFLLAEMYGYNLAAAHHGLRYTIAHSFMVSDVTSAGEGWNTVQKVPAEDVCGSFPESSYPHVLHYCQRYFLGKWFFSKYKLRKDFISCESPLLRVPPEDLAVKYRTSISPDGMFHQNMNPAIAKSHAFMICAMIAAVNEASVYFKDHHCNKTTANYEYSLTFHQDMTMPHESR